MAKIMCKGCGSVTNTSFVIRDENYEAIACLQKWEGGTWKKGCFRKKDMKKHQK